jgi:Fumarylacetoacetate (FAA) hydrolase family
MIFDVATLLSYVSEFMTLLPGDVISTGTPAGVGLGMKPAQYLKSGDVVELGIEGLGESRQRVVNLAGLGVHHSYRLLSCVKVAIFNLHLGLPRSEPFLVGYRKCTRSVAMPTSSIYSVITPRLG